MAKDFSELGFIQIKDPNAFRRIPPYLFEQAKEYHFNIEKIYDLAPAFLNSLLVYALVGKDFTIKGVLLTSVNVFTNTIHVHLLSVDKEYQFSSALEDTLKFVKSWDENAIIEIITTRPHSYEKLGWKQSKRKIMEI